MITDHKFRTLCMHDCKQCLAEENNMCSIVINDYGKTCYKTRAEHSESYHDDKVLAV